VFNIQLFNITGAVYETEDHSTLNLYLLHKTF